MDLIAGAYLGLTLLLLLFGWRRIPNGGGLLLIHLGVLLSVLLLGFLPRRGNNFLMFFRDTYALWGLPLFYKDVGMLHRILHSGFYDAIVLKWEQALFGPFPSVWLRVWLPSERLDELLHVSYIAYYAIIPILGLWFYLQGREELCRVVATTVMLAFSTCFLIFIAFPVAGPYYVFVQNGGEAGLLPRFVHAIVKGSAGRGTAFPSAHVAGALVVLWMTCRFERPLVPLIGILSTGIAFGVVYCGFHYGVDVLAGLGIGVICSLLGPRLHHRFLRWTQARRWAIPLPHVALRRIARMRRARSGPDSGRLDPFA